MIAELLKDMKVNIITELILNKTLKIVKIPNQYFFKLKKFDSFSLWTRMLQ